MADFTDIRLALQDARLFIVYRLEVRADGKLDKIPTSPVYGTNIDPHDPREWLTGAEAVMWASQLNADGLPAGVFGYGTGVVISELAPLPNGRRLFALDLDSCRDGDRWAPHAAAFIAKLPGGGVEVSVSGNGLHVYGTYSGPRADHGTRNKTYRMELYTRLRFIACTGNGAMGDPLKDLTRELWALTAEYFPPHEDADYGPELSTAPVPDWLGPADDEELLRRAMRSYSAATVFGGRAAFGDIWNATESVLAKVFPPQQHGVYDASAADQALANHLAFWTGSHGERMLRLMWQSKLVRTKWERPGYLHNTIQRACASQRQWYKDPRGAASAEAPSGDSLKLPDARADVAGAALSEPLNGAVILDAPPAPVARPPIGEYVLVENQKRLFAGYTYVQDINQIMTPIGHTLSTDRFDTEFSGYTFAMTADGQSPAKKASEAFIFSQLYAFPKVKGLYFDPKVPPQTVEWRDQSAFINSYVPSIIVRRRGDVQPFLDHLHKLLPNENDADILLAYFAACVQYKGDKFQWWPLIQGVEGNGKTTLSYLLEYAVGTRYTHWPKSGELGSKFNSAFYGKLLICCEDVYVSESRGSLWETLKPMITSTKIEIEAKGVDKVTREVCFNGVMNSNHKNAIRKTANDRRIGPFFCAQQSKLDLRRDGMNKDYFKRLRSWRLGEGREVVADYLMRYEIPDEWNPATSSIVCPETTATREAIHASFGVAEQEVVEAINQGTLGFRGGWISSSALDRLLAGIGKGGSIPRNRRGELLETLDYMPHPALKDGRATQNDTDGTRPRLYVLATSPAAQERDPGAVMSLYLAAQKG